MEDVKPDTAGNKLTVIGKVDPIKVRDKLAEKIKKNVELVSSPPTKAAAVDKPPPAKIKHDEEEEKKKKKPDEKKAEEKQPKQVRISLPFSIRCTVTKRKRISP